MKKCLHQKKTKAPKRPKPEPQMSWREKRDAERKARGKGLRAAMGGLEMAVAAALIGANAAKR